MRTELIPVGDVELHVVRLGVPRDGVPPVVVLHGGPSWDHSYLLPGLVPLAAHREVIVYDLRGCGRSSRDLPIEAYQPQAIVDDTRGLIEKLGFERVDLLGFSTGGQVAQLFVEAHPGLVRRLVLASTTAYGDVGEHLAGWPEYQRRAAEAEPVPDFLEPLQWTVRHARSGATTAIWNLDRLGEYRRLLDAIVFSGDWLAPWREGRLGPWRPADPAKVLREWGGPLLILHGEQDMGFPLPVAERLHEEVPGSVLAVVPAAGHMAHFENPALWAGNVTLFLDK
ncbi:acetyltransferase [Actinorhabdospora filicis]|uniref:Acetyltransferase n=1 Tax=Actinorhabdospora filicis TaxID=1785913 RepID=A0A9W6SRH8_9ACTN|nr:alpha/beta hydrolase [Actinorhabdospora filicis]GLZ80758.1 acetyltransferase [Actinorhabdospora filicis]